MDPCGAIEVRPRFGDSRGYTFIEILVVMIIGVILTGAMIMLWVNITRSGAVTTSHAEARDIARSGVARLSREIRDVEALPGAQAIQEAGPFSIAFYTTFNRVGAEVESTKPRLVRYSYNQTEKRLYRYVYADGIVDLTSSPTPVRTEVLIPHMLNDTDTPLFGYVYMDVDGNRWPAPSPSNQPVHEVTDAGDRSRILLVSIHALVDLNPGRAPTPMEITTDAQLRNQRLLY